MAKKGWKIQSLTNYDNLGLQICISKNETKSMITERCWLKIKL